MNVLGLAKFFPVVVLGEECKAAKPDPEPYRVALQRLGVRPTEAVVFEDSAAGIRAARGAGVATVGVTTALPAEQLKQLGCFMVIDDYRDPDLLETMRAWVEFPAPGVGS